jgi:hypothetical protein
MKKILVIIIIAILAVLILDYNGYADKNVIWDDVKTFAENIWSSFTS